jgi:DNA-directed RNA polymerase specialized sigma24 family protein
MRRDATSDAEFTEFAAANRARLRSTAYLLCGDWERASDHVQEGLIRVYVAWPRLVRKGGELAYARKAVVSAFLDSTRKRSSTEQPSSGHPDRASREDVAVPEGYFLWDTPVNNRSGATQWLGRLLP